jgi:hypothetical protein
MIGGRGGPQTAVFAKVRGGPQTAVFGPQTAVLGYQTAVFDNDGYYK